MEGKPSPHLKKVLKSYQLSAANTMSGPSSIMSRIDNPGSVSRNRNGSFDGTTPSLVEPGSQIFQQSPSSASALKQQQHSLKSSPVFSRSMSVSLGGSHQAQLGSGLSKIAVVNGIKQPGGGRETPVKGAAAAGGFELQGDGGSTLIIKSTAQQLPPPILSTPDRARPEKRDTILEGELIACFSVGGEKRKFYHHTFKYMLSKYWSIHFWDNDKIKMQFLNF